MKISGIRSSIVALPADEPLAGAAENPNGTRPIVTLEVQTDDGAVGVGATYFGGAPTGTLKSAVEELGVLCIGEDPVRVEMVTAKLRAAAGSAGRHTRFGRCLAIVNGRSRISGARISVCVASLRPTRVTASAETDARGGARECRLFKAGTGRNRTVLFPEQFQALAVNGWPGGKLIAIGLRTKQECRRRLPSLSAIDPAPLREREQSRFERVQSGQPCSEDAA
jgi:hypothetical protein